MMDLFIMKVLAAKYKMIIGLIIALAIGCYVILSVYNDTEISRKSLVSIVSVNRSRADQHNSIKTDHHNTTSNTELAARSDFRALEERFATEIRNPGWASSAEEYIRRDLHRYGEIANVEIVCKSSICRTSGEIRSADTSRLDETLEGLRRAVKFDQPSDDFVQHPDNTIYTVISPRPLIIGFTNYARW